MAGSLYDLMGDLRLRCPTARGHSPLFVAEMPRAGTSIPAVQTLLENGSLALIVC